MKARTTLLVTALAVGAVSLPSLAQQQRGAGQQAQQQQRQQTMEESKQAIRQDLESRFPGEAVEIPEREPVEMRQTITAVVRNAVQPGKLNDALTQLSRVNRNELGQLSEARRKALIEELQAFEGAFQQKYNEPLNFDRYELFSDAVLVRVEVKDSEAIGRLPLRPVAAPQQRDVARAPAGEAQAQPAAGTEGGRQRQYGASANTFGVADGSKIGLMGLPREAGAQRMIVTALEESRPAAGEQAGEWRLIVPMDLTADTLAENLTQHLRNLRQRQNQWPDDADKMRDTIARRVLMAFYNLDPVTQPAAGSANQPQQQQQRQQQGQPNQGRN